MQFQKNIMLKYLLVSLIVMLAQVQLVVCLPTPKPETAGQVTGNAIKKAGNAIGCIAKYQGVKC
jgi:hypothetical protein